MLIKKNDESIWINKYACVKSYLLYIKPLFRVFLFIIFLSVNYLIRSASILIIIIIIATEYYWIIIATELPINITAFFS